jgi:hypothetical protein
MVDERSAFWRAVGRTQFQIGPAAILQMAAYLGVQLDENTQPLLQADATEEQKNRAALITLLNAKKLADPRNSGAFRNFLTEGATAKVADLLRTYDRKLLHLCALSRD